MFSLLLLFWIEYISENFPQMFLDSLSPPLVVVVFIAVVTVILIDVLVAIVIGVSFVVAVVVVAVVVVAVVVVVVVEALTLAGAKISFLFPFSVSDLFLSFFEEKSLKRPSGQ